MSEHTIFNYIIIAWFILAAVVFISLFFFSAPYGRHSRKGWGPTTNDTTGWVIMEIGAPLLFAACFILGKRPASMVSFVFLGLWEAHYLHRSFIYPFTIRGSAKHMSVTVIILGFFFNMVNGYINGRYLFTFSPGYGAGWFTDPRFIAGATMIVCGYIINRQADTILRNLRKPGETGYKIPFGSLYRWVSCPNYLGEIIIWLGWAMATWSLPGLAFALWTIANLAPRAYTNHRWYRRQFSDYPANRKALIPGVW